MRKTLKDVEHLIYDTVDTAEQKCYAEGYKVGYAEGYKAGYEEGQQEVREEIASNFVKRMVQQGYSDEEIQAVSPLSAEEIFKFKNGT
ncbi:MAG: hypothetical protein F4082_07865 [Gammaproteobacteria bacterium]|nr:hypothetical protein [Gammaproteobacteria bacterium]